MSTCHKLAALNTQVFTQASNAKGGKWIIRLPKGLASRYWEEIILALIGGQ
jgi:translation initiation factor 4E